MACIQTSPLPKSYTAPSPSKAAGSSPLLSRTLLAAGPAFLSHLRLSLHHGNSFDAQESHNEKERIRLQEIQSLLANGEDDLGVGDESESEELLSLDPKEWKVR